MKLLTCVLRRTTSLAMPIIAVLCWVAAAPLPARAFSQCGGQGCGITPVGHEYLTIRGGKLVIEEWGRLPNGNRWREVLRVLERLPDGIRNRSSSDYGTKQHNLWAAAMGQRWVDTSGLFVPGKHKGINCWDAVNQMPDDVQYDHALRKSTETGTAGFTASLAGIKARFKKGFVEAATAEEGVVKFWDGGTVPKRFKASRPFFLLGRPIHLIQDSYSPEHARRVSSQGHPDFGEITDIKSYVCTEKSDWHRHQAPLAANADHGDIIWAKNGPASIPVMGVAPGNHDDKLRGEARGALLATKAVWEGFLEVRAMPAGTNQEKQARHARAEAVADHIIALHFFSQGLLVEKPSGDVAGCKRDTLMPAIGTSKRRKCLSRMKAKAQTEWDEYLLMPYDWDWTNDRNHSVLKEHNSAPQALKTVLARIDQEQLDDDDVHSESEGSVSIESLEGSDSE
jgi:hypothetical protein